MKKPARTPVAKSGILAKNTLINFLGQAIPLLFALIAIPFVIDGLGTERFGILTIVWIVTGYFSLFDMGIGKATTKFVADFESQKEGDLFPIIITSISLLVVFGIFGSLLILLITPVLVQDILNIPPELRQETSSAFYILSLSIPFILGSIGARGVLEAQQRFDIVNAVKIPASIINYVGPLGVILFYDYHLQPVVTLLVAARSITFFVYLYYSFQGERFVGLTDYPVKKLVKELLSFGAWLTVSNIISPMMQYLDRFILGAILTMSAVAYYTTPYEIISRMLIISGSFMGVMFPAFSVFSLQDKQKMIDLFYSSIRYLVLAIVPVVVFIILSAYPLLYHWLGSEFAENSTLVMQILAAGIVANSLAMVPSTAIQAAGRPDIRAKIHMFELPVYLIMIWYLTKNFGIAGVAVAWTIRVVLDGALILYFFNRLIPVIKKRWNKIVLNISVYGGLTVLIGFFYPFIDNLFAVYLYALLSAVAIFFTIWIFTLKKHEKERLFRLLRNLKKNFSTKNLSSGNL